MKTKLQKHKMRIIIISILILAFGGVFSYINYGTEPKETIGGFIVGFGFGLLLIGLGTTSKTYGHFKTQHHVR